MIRIETLPGTTDSPAIARELIRSEMADCNDDAVAAAELMISELVTNAVVHGATPIRLNLQHEVKADVITAVVQTVAKGDQYQGTPQSLTHTDGDSSSCGP